MSDKTRNIFIVIFLGVLVFSIFYFLVVRSTNETQRLQMERENQTYAENRSTALMDCQAMINKRMANGDFNTAYSYTEAKQLIELAMTDCMRSKGFDK